MGIDVPSADDVHQMFASAIHQACPNESNDAPEWSRLLRGLTSPNWQPHSHGIETLAIDDQYGLFRVTQTITVDQHRDSQRPPIQESLNDMGTALQQFIPGNANVRIELDAATSKDVPIGFDVTCIARGVIVTASPEE